MPVIVDHVALVSPSVATLQCNYTYLLYISQPTFPFTSTQKRKFSKKKKKKQKDPTNFSSSIWKFFPSTIPRFQSLPPFFPPLPNLRQNFSSKPVHSPAEFLFFSWPIGTKRRIESNDSPFPSASPGDQLF